MGSSEESRVLCVGLVCVDIICVTSSYPVEDSDERALEQRWQRGGNASNICTVLSYLNTPCEYLGTVASDENAGFLVANFKANRIPTRHCVFHHGCTTPSSIVIVSNENGSRTIIAGTRNLPELSPEDFKHINLSTRLYHWIHFEGRPNSKNIRKMIEMVDDYNSTVETENQRIITSLEFEKKREGIDDLQGLADYLFVSKDFAAYKGYANMEDAVRGFAKGCKPGGTVICAWGALGAAAFSTETNMLVTSPSFPSGPVVDTLGAGDTFIAATIRSLSNNRDIKEAIACGCQVAGAKVGMKGFEGLKDRFMSII